MVHGDFNLSFIIISSNFIFSPEDDKDNIFLYFATLGTMLDALKYYFFINLNNFWQGDRHYFHFIDEESKAQRNCAPVLSTV